MIMMVLLYVVMLVLLFVIALMLQRLFNGPTIFDRMNALGVIGADTICLIVVFGFIDKRPDMYVDIAISYALLGFLGSLIVAKCIGQQRDAGLHADLHRPYDLRRGDTDLSQDRIRLSSGFHGEPDRLTYPEQVGL